MIQVLAFAGICLSKMHVIRERKTFANEYNNDHSKRSTVHRWSDPDLLLNDLLVCRRTVWTCLWQPLFIAIKQGQQCVSHTCIPNVCDQCHFIFLNHCHFWICIYFLTVKQNNHAIVKTSHMQCFGPFSHLIGLALVCCFM